MAKLTRFQAQGLFAIALDYGCPANRYEEFMEYFTEEHGSHEYRCFQDLGFGGKLYMDNDRRLYASYYPEDSTPERDQVLVDINVALQKYKEKWIDGDLRRTTPG